MPVPTELNDVLSVAHPGGDALAELHAWLKARTVAANDWVEVSWRGWGRGQNFNLAGVVFTDGTTFGAGAQVGFWYSPNQAFVTLANHTNFSTTGTSSTFGVQNESPAHDVFLRLVYLGSNTWRGLVSCDGVSYINVTGDLTRTLTPTHAGFFVSTWGGSAPYIFSFRYCRFGNG